MTTTSKTISDKDLVHQINQGDKHAFHILFDRYEAKVYRFCVLILGDVEVAHDIYQETFFKFFLSCRKGEEIRNARGWLLSKARSLCLNFLRDSKRRQELLKKQAPRPYSYIEVNSIGVDQHLQEALNKIPDHYREALLLFQVEGYSYQEIAEIINADFHTVKNRIYQAKRSLQAILGPIYQEENPNRPRKG